MISSADRNGLIEKLIQRADHHLQNLKTVGAQTKPAGNPLGGLAAEVPDWELRRLKAALKLLGYEDGEK
jgi:hypothetical protein